MTTALAHSPAELSTAPFSLASDCFTNSIERFTNTGWPCILLLFLVMKEEKIMMGSKIEWIPVHKDNLFRAPRKNKKTIAKYKVITAFVICL